MKKKFVKYFKFLTQTKALLLVVIALQLYVLARIDEVEKVSKMAYSFAYQASDYAYDIKRQVSEIEDDVDELRYR